MLLNANMSTKVGREISATGAIFRKLKGERTNTKREELSRVRYRILTILQVTVEQDNKEAETIRKRRSGDNKRGARGKQGYRTYVLIFLHPPLSGWEFSLSLLSLLSAFFLSRPIRTERLVLERSGPLAYSL